MKDVLTVVLLVNDDRFDGGRQRFNDAPQTGGHVTVTAPRAVGNGGLVAAKREISMRAASGCSVVY